MPVSGVGPTGSNYPAIPPSNPMPASILMMLSKLAEIAGSLTKPIKS